MRMLLGVFLVCLPVYLANGRPHPEVDCMAAPYVAWSLLRHGSCDVRYYPELKKYVGTIHIQKQPDGACVPMRTPGSALAAVPLMAPVALLHDQPLGETDMQQLGKLAAAISIAAAAALFFAVCRTVAPGAAWPATMLFAFGTCLYSVASQALWTHGPAVFWLCCALYLLTRARSDGQAAGVLHWLAAGLTLGLAVYTRPTTAFFTVATGVALLTRRQWRGAAWLAVGGLLPVAALCWYNWSHFGHVLLGGYESDNWTASPPLWIGLSGLLVAPSRGVFVYSPALLLALPGAWLLVGPGCRPGPDDRKGPARQAGSTKDIRVLLLAWLISAVVTLLFYARWYDWRGGWCYGPRFLCETMPVLCLLFAIAYERWPFGWRRWTANGLVILSVLVHFIGVAGHSGYEDWQTRHALDDQGRCLFALEDTQIEAHLLALVDKFSARQGDKVTR